MTLLFLELNEVNFDQVKAYAEEGLLPNIALFIGKHGVNETTSEAAYENLEPWIQWVSAHTALTFAEHGVFRLGDICGKGFTQIWEAAEDQGVKVGAISPMNAENRCANPAFFVPDPWTSTKVTGRRRLEALYKSIVTAVNGNAESKLSVQSMISLAVGLGQYASFAMYTDYLSDLWGVVRRRSWRKAIFLDRLLADVFIAETRSHRPGFATLFLNAAAHIQHHYLFNSSTYRGDLRNPDWYVKREFDPLLDVYKAYDAILGRVIHSFPDARIMIATGLHQEPHGVTTLYWRLRDHASFLRQVGICFSSVEPRMSRDFVIFFDSERQALDAVERLSGVLALDGRPIFSISNRGDSIFAELIWSEEIGPEFVYLVDGEQRLGFLRDVVFVAVKNGEHSGIGYFLDSGWNAHRAIRFPITELPRKVCDALGIVWQKPQPS